MSLILNALADWAKVRQVDLANCTVNTGVWRTDYSGEADEHGKYPITLKETPTISIQVTMGAVPAENLRAFKRVFGKMAPGGSPPYVRLTGSEEFIFEAQTIEIEVTILGAFECEYTCKPQVSPKLVAELSDSDALAYGFTESNFRDIKEAHEAA